MKRTGLFLTMTLALLPVLSVAQAARLKMPDFSGLAGKAKESVDITLDGDTLKMASGFVGGGKTNDPEFAEAVKSLQGIYLKVFSFDKPGMYSMRDIESVVSQVETQGWKKLMSIRDKDDRVEMWLRTDGADAADSGMLFVATEPKELVLINIVGKVDLQTLAKLQGRMGVPFMPGIPGVRPPAPPAPPAPGARAAPPAPPAAPASAAAPAQPAPPAPRVATQP
jgi:hypothetical protein